MSSFGDLKIQMWSYPSLSTHSYIVPWKFLLCLILPYYTLFNFESKVVNPDSWNLMDKNWKKNTAENSFSFCWSKNAIYLSLGLPKERPSYRRSLERSKENIQQFKRWILLTLLYFSESFLPSWIQIRILIANLDKDPGTPFNPDSIRIRIHNTDFDDPEPGLVLNRVRRKIDKEWSVPDSEYIIPNAVCMKNNHLQTK